MKSQSAKTSKKKTPKKKSARKKTADEKAVEEWEAEKERRAKSAAKRRALRSKWCPAAQEFYAQVVKDWSVDENDHATIALIRSAAETLDRAEACKQQYIEEGVIVYHATGNGGSEKLNPAINAERQLRSTFVAICKSLGLLEEGTED